MMQQSNGRVPARRGSVIIQHEDWQDASSFIFQCREWAKARLTNPPTLYDGKGEPAPGGGAMAAYINHGRWIAECAVAGCGYAIVTSVGFPYLLCANPACFDDEWHEVIFPANRVGIEEVLLHRPALDRFRARTRNWYPGETIGKLRAENTGHGISNP